MKIDAERILRSPLLLPILLALGAWLAVARGQDALWDLKNYHLYNAWALLHGRLSIDLAPAGLQGYFNPLPDVPYLWLGMGPLQDHPRLLAAWQGMWYGALVYVLCRIGMRFARMTGRRPGWSTIAAVFIGATGTMTLTQAGQATNEVPLALLVLMGFLVAMPLVDENVTEARSSIPRALVAGLLCGLAAGLKPTAIVYAPALGLAAWVAHGGRAKGFGAFFFIGVGAVTGFLLAYGYWGWSLWQLTGNPVFPMFNGVFKSPWVITQAGTDQAMMPKSVLQALFYPFWWLVKNRTQGSGNPFADARYAIAMVAILAWAVVVLSRRFRQESPRPLRLLIGFVALSYVMWLALYSILRYAIPIEALTGLVVLAVLQYIAGLPSLGGAARRIVPIALTAVVLIVLSTTRYTDWGHAPFGKKAFDIGVPPIEPGSLVVLVSEPNAYLAPFIPNVDTSRLVGMTWFNAWGDGHELGERVRTAVEGHKGRIYVIRRDDEDAQAQYGRLLRYLPGATPANCRPIVSQIEQTRRRRDISDGLQLCEIIRS